MCEMVDGLFRLQHQDIAMFEFLVLDTSTIVGGALIVLVLAFFRFGQGLVDLLVSFRSSPVEAVEKTMREQD